MPLYEFECSYCGHRFEDLCSVPRREKQLCPLCTHSTQVCVAPFSARVFKPYVHDNLDRKPVQIENRKQERYEFESRGLIDAR